MTQELDMHCIVPTFCSGWLIPHPTRPILGTMYMYSIIDKLGVAGRWVAATLKRAGILF